MELSLSYTIIIPARYHSTRLSAKPLQQIQGQALIEYTYNNAIQTQAKQVIIATDHPKIRDACQAFNARVVMTPSSIATGSDRVSATAKLLDLNSNEIIINLQGDEPLLTADAIDNLYQFHRKHDFFMSTLFYRNQDMKQFNHNSTVKVIFDSQNRAISFSRSPIPHGQKNEFKQHLGIYAYTRSCLEEFNQLPRSELEDIESLEQLRALWYQKSIGITEAQLSHPPIGIDTHEDVDRFIDYLALS